MKNSFRKPVVWFSLLSAAAGCQTTASRSPLRLDSLTSAKATSGADAVRASQAMVSGTLPQGGLANSSLGGGYGQSPVSSQSTLAQVVPASSARVRSTVDSMRDALKIEPRVMPSADPTNLQSNPGPLQPGLFLAAAQLLESQGQLDQAQAKYQELLRMDPNHRAALIGLARLEHRRGNLDAAIAGYQHALRTAGSDPVVLNDLGLCLARAGRTTAGVEALRAAVQGKPDSLLYRNNLAATLVEAQRIDEAIATLAESHGPAVAHYNVGYMLNQRGETDLAYAHFQQSLEMDPGFGPARTMLERIAPQISRGAAPARTPSDLDQASAVPAERASLPTSLGVVPASVATTDGLAPVVARPAAFAQPSAICETPETHSPVAEPPQMARIIAVVEPPRSAELQLGGDVSTVEVAPVQHWEPVLGLEENELASGAEPAEPPRIRMPLERARSLASPIGLIAPTPENLP